MMNGCYDNCGCQCGNNGYHGDSSIIWIIIAVVVVVWLFGRDGNCGSGGNCCC